MAKGIRTAVTARRAAAIAIAGAAAATLSACGAGQVTQTDVKVSAIAGVNLDEGDLALRDLQVEFDSAEGYAAGDDAALRAWIGNEGDDEARLTGVVAYASEEDALADADETLTDTWAGTVTLVSPAAPVEETPAEDATPSEGTSESPAGETPSEGESESPAAEEPEFEGDPVIDVAIAPSDYVRLDQGVEDGDYLLVEDLAVDLPVGGRLWVKFVFADGTEALAALPIGQDLTGDEEREYYEPEEAAEGH
ncbi:hypothetical protein [Glycomyces terrestris]|uniref:Copper chaperone PCu(A)C n=1 Tax=Glycomyces terrestris TaxID=2493553 RepID=A0A426USC6_9ACTN|nr:hypothetical protein [Glycomyces terrestris]RRR96393.1 hypothetical protein EIW28_21350 [Glycomyces terrestris]